MFVALTKILARSYIMERPNNNDKKIYQTNSRDLDDKINEIRKWISTEHSLTSKILSISDIMVNHALGYNKSKRIYLQLQSEKIIDENGFIL